MSTRKVVGFDSDSEPVILTVCLHLKELEGLVKILCFNFRI